MLGGVDPRFLRDGALLALTLFVVVTCVQGRQMCYTCSYNQNPLEQGIDCVRSPGDWRSGHPRMKCEFRCIITSIWNKKSGNATYMFRGCSGSHDVGKDQCMESELEYHCSWSCADEHYCNVGKGRVAMEELDPDGAATLAAGLLMPLLLPFVAMVIVNTNA